MKEEYIIAAIFLIISIGLVYVARSVVPNMPLLPLLLSAFFLFSAAYWLDRGVRAKKK